MLLHAVALRLGKTVDEIGDMDCDEFISWLAFFELQRENR